MRDGRVRGWTFYCKSSGLEVSLAERAGGVRVRFFPLEAGGRERQVVLLLRPEEAVRLASVLVASRVGREGSSRVVYHELQGRASYITVDAFQRDGRLRIGLTAVSQNGADARRVPFLFTDEGLELFVMLLKQLAVESCYIESHGRKLNRTM